MKLLSSKNDRVLNLPDHLAKRLLKKKRFSEINNLKKEKDEKNISDSHNVSKPGRPKGSGKSK
jgi:hypothetical protein